MEQSRVDNPGTQATLGTERRQINKIHNTQHRKLK